MIRLDLPRYRKARVWVENLPSALFESERTLEHTIPASKQISVATQRIIIVELLVPKGPRLEYGLLGAELQSELSAELRILVNIAPASSLASNDSLLPRALDEVKIGLPFPYGEAVIKGVTAVAKEMSELVTGKLHFKYAALGNVSSSAAIFELLGRTVFRLLMTGDIPVHKEQLIPFFDGN